MSDGIYTTSRRILCERLGDITEKQTYGTLVLKFPPPENMVLVKEDDSDTYSWDWDISDNVASGKYLNGSGVQDADWDPSGSVIFNHYIAGGEYDCGCPQMRLRIEWDATIPEKSGDL